MTASCVRAAIEANLLSEGDITKLYYMGPMFRAERPQAGRKRQFHQAGVEVFGSDDPVVDAHTIALLDRFLKYLGLRQFTIKINNLGTSESRKKYLEQLTPYFEKVKNQLCEDCHFRLEKNVLRVFDCKNPHCRKHIDEAPKIFDAMDEDSKSRFKEVEAFLKILNVSYTIEKGLVRGLDYYSQTVFEVSSPALGAQDALGAGGRYDRLVADCGGPKIGAIGFAVGLERLIDALEKENVFSKMDETKQPLIYLANIDRPGLTFTLTLSEELRQKGIGVMMNELGKSLKAQLRQADKYKARFVVICGEEEIKSGELTVKDLANHKEVKMKKSDLLKELGR
jgi:histidyl-tRNA synthetase